MCGSLFTVCLFHSEVYLHLGVQETVLRLSEMVIPICIHTLVHLHMYNSDPLKVILCYLDHTVHIRRLLKRSHTVHEASPNLQHHRQPTDGMNRACIVQYIIL